MLPVYVPSKTVTRYILMITATETGYKVAKQGIRSAGITMEEFLIFLTIVDHLLFSDIY